MDETIKVPVAVKEKILSDVTVTADMDSALYIAWHLPQEERLQRRMRRLEELVEEFNSFIRDHRSMDHVRLSVERVYDEVCSVCGDVWEPVMQDGLMYCASCDALIET